MHPEVTSAQTHKILRLIFSSPVFDDFYLVGGTGLALQLGHRRSEDIDFFTQEEFDASLLAELKKLGKLQVISAHHNSIEVFVNDTRVYLMYFVYPLYKPLKKIEEIRVADPVDIGLMKLLSLTGRDTRKDIIDLYFIDQEVIRLEELLQVFDSFYPPDSFNSYDAVKSLFNKGKLDQQPALLMIKKVDWETVYERVSEAVLGFSKSKV